MLQDLRFRPLARPDLHRLHGWLNEPLVVEWYSRRPPSMVEVEAKYAPRLRDDSAVRVFLFSVDNVDAGFIQKYSMDAFPEYARTTQAEADWIGIDFLVGEPTFRGRGLGSRMIDAFVAAHVFADARRACCAGPLAANERSIRALRAAGFEPLRDITLETGDVERLMVRRALVADRTRS